MVLNNLNEILFLLFTSQHRRYALLREDDQEDPLSDELQEQHDAGADVTTPQRSDGRFRVEDALRLSPALLLSGYLNELIDFNFPPVITLQLDTSNFFL